MGTAYSFVAPVAPDERARPKRISHTEKDINKLANLEAALDKKLDRKTAEYFSKNGHKNATTRDKP